MNILFVTWDGPSANYLESLFCPIFGRLSEYGYKFHIMQFTWAPHDQRERTRQICNGYGIPYRSVSVLRKPVAFGSLLTATLGKRAYMRAIREWDIGIVMPRATLPALTAILFSKRSNIPLIFDSDGLPIDEKVEFQGMSQSSIAHSLLRDIEARVVRQADAVLVRSKKAIDVLAARGGPGTSLQKFSVVTNGRDQNIYCPISKSERAAVRAELGVFDSTPILVYVGSLGEKYRFDLALRFYSIVLRFNPKSKFLILSGNTEIAFREIKRFSRNIGIGCVVKTVGAHEVPRFLSACDLGLSFYEPSFSTCAIAPLKIAEYLLCGLPVVARTKNIGNMEDIIDESVGFAIESGSAEELEQAAEWFHLHLSSFSLNELSSNSRLRGIEYFGIDRAVQDYLDVLEEFS